MRLIRNLRSWLEKFELEPEHSAKLPTVTFATSCWEHDWRPIVLNGNYLQRQQIENHKFRFAERLLVINNVADLDEVKSAAEARVEAGILSRVVCAEDIAVDALKFFHLSRKDFESETYDSNWLFFNALAPLAAIYSAKSDYLLYLTGDSYLDKPVRWIPKALKALQRTSSYKVANLTWNHQYNEAKEEADTQDEDFYIASQGFSDQMFLIKVDDFRQPIYGQIRADAAHFPRGDTFEKRCFSHMKNHGWRRITYKHGSYIHRNF